MLRSQQTTLDWQIKIPVTTNYSSLPELGVPQLALVPGVPSDKVSTALAFSAERGRGTPRRVVRTDVKLLFLSLCLGVLLIPGCGASQPVSTLGDLTPKAHRYPDAHEVRGAFTKFEYDAVRLSRRETVVLSVAVELNLLRPGPPLDCHYPNAQKIRGNKTVTR